MVFIQGTSNDYVSIHLFLRQASVSYLSIALVTRTLLQLGLGGVYNLWWFYFCIEPMEYVKNLFSLKSNNLLIYGACVIEVYKLRVKIRSFIRKVIEVEVCSV
jgi:hypothetical protein